MNGVSKVANGNELESGSDSAIEYSRHWQWGTTDYIESWLESVQLKVAMRDRRVCSEMVRVSRIESGNEGQRSLKTDGWSQ